MKKLVILLFFSQFNIYCQDSSAIKATRAENKTVYNNNTIKIFRGQRLNVSLSSLPGQQNSLKLIDTTVSTILNFAQLSKDLEKSSDSKNITIDFNVIMQNGRLMTVLVVRNPFNERLSYKAKIFSSRTNEYHETSIIPILGGIPGVETWPFLINDFVLYDFKVEK